MVDKPKAFRIEKDSMGELEVPREALYGAQTQRAVENFPISGLRMPLDFIHALAQIKKACALANTDIGGLESEVSDAICRVCDEIVSGIHDTQFPVDVFQTGSGTSTNMNMNEVLGRKASIDSGLSIHPNDHVNMSQSSNDVIPTTIHVSSITACREQLLPSMNHLADVVDRKAEQLADVVKTGRTHLMDAMPVTMQQELSAWSQQIRNNITRIESQLDDMSQLAIGGTAVGTGINSDARFGELVCEHLTSSSGHAFRVAENRFERLSSQDATVALSGCLKSTAVSLMKISNDLRWMNSGPLAGLAEIALPALQPGSSIMPGKVNPVIPESVAMVSAKVIGNDTTITVAGQSGNFQLNVMLPVIGYTILESIQLLSTACATLADKAIADFEVLHENITDAVAKNPILVTALNRVIGYEQGALIAKKAYAEGRPVIEVATEMTDISREELERILSPSDLT